METVEIIRTSHTIDPVKIRIARAEKGWSITKLAETAGITRYTISNIEKQKNKTIQFETLEKIAKGLDRDIEDFLI